VAGRHSGAEPLLYHRRRYAKWPAAEPGQSAPLA
jgi:hypothetical protein